MINTRSKETDLERRNRGIYAKSCSDSSLSVIKQWESIRSNSNKYKEVCEKHSNRMKKVWTEYSEETKNRIISSLVNSCGKSRSKISEQLKSEMLENDLYDGFISEEVFHGFVVDEINHDLKIIVEMFGDLYHCNPRKYKDSSLYVKAIQRTVEEQWLRDRRRFACFNSHGYTTIVVWEYDFRRNSKFQIERIKNEIDQKRKN